MSDRAICYDVNENMVIISNPDLTQLTSCYELTGNTDLNSAATVDIPFDSASYFALSPFLTKSSSTQFNIDIAGVYRIDFYCSADDSLAAVRVDIIKNNGIDVVLCKSGLTKNCSMGVIANFDVDDYIYLKANRIGLVSTSMNVSSGFSKLIITKLG